MAIITFKLLYRLRKLTMCFRTKSLEAIKISEHIVHAICDRFGIGVVLELDHLLSVTEVFYYCLLSYTKLRDIKFPTVMITFIHLVKQYRSLMQNRTNLFTQEFPCESQQCTSIICILHSILTVSNIPHEHLYTLYLWKG